MQINDRVSEIVIFQEKKWKIIADDAHSSALKKEWDYIIQNIETGETKKVFKNQLEVPICESELHN